MRPSTRARRIGRQRAGKRLKEARADLSLRSRALLAFQYRKTEVIFDLEGLERREPTVDAQLGALILAEEGSAQLSLVETFGKFVEAWAKVHGPRK